jgi:Ca2+-binding EF-hand superfamily protein
VAKRRDYFKTMDTDNNGLISFNEWLTYAMKHIMQKVNRHLDLEINIDNVLVL